tara:strand:+ start:150408 stop:151175 length:768 start_codon:yes stop_codon:yes gene_type:complete
MNNIIPISAFSDNYIWAIPSTTGSELAVVDPGDAVPVLHYLDSHGLTLNAIVITHHHWDHTGGLPKLLERFPDVTIYGPETISGINYPVKEGSKIHLQPQNLSLEVIAIPGHTLDHIAYIGKGLVFCGDTLFSAGCGRLFEGTAEQMYHSLNKLKQLPDNTLVYCAHEYTLANLKFAHYIEPSNLDIKQKISDVEQIREQKLPSLPSTMAVEKKINPFLRSLEESVIKSIVEKSANNSQSNTEIFAALRKLKDQF